MLDLKILNATFAILQLAITSEIPDRFNAVWWFKQISYCHDEISFVCDQDAVPTGFDWMIDRNWKCFFVSEIHDLTMTGVTAWLTKVLAESDINLFCLATYNTDYVLVPENKLSLAIEKMKKAGYSFVDE